MELNSELDRLKKYKEIEAELLKAERKHSNWPIHDMYKQVTILQEEAGEVSKAVLKYFDEGGSLDDIKSELHQTAAMCIRMLKNLDETANQCIS